MVFHMNFIVQSVCISSITIGLIFVVLELRARLDRGFLYFGFMIIALSVALAFDIWYPPFPTDYRIKAIQNAVIAFFCICQVHTLQSLIKRKIPLAIAIFDSIFSLFIALYGCAMLFRWGVLNLADPSKGTDFIYDYGFAPAILAMAIYSITMLLRGRRTARLESDRRVIAFYLIGGAFLVIFGNFDMFYWAFPGFYISPFYIQMAIFVMVATVTYAFSERLLAILDERRKFTRRLSDAYQELERTRPLSHLGQKSAIIAHEIKNRIFSVATFLETAQRNPSLTAPQRESLTKAASIVMGISQLSKDILAESHTLKLAAEPMVLRSIIDATIDRHYSHRRNVITISDQSNRAMIKGENSKLESVFVNLFENSLDAGAKSIDIRLLTDHSSVLAVIEDNGEGCGSDVLGSIFTVFFSTKTGQQGTGLGMSIVKSIVENHGGSISAYSKNLAAGPGSGLVITMTFPRHQDPEASTDGVQIPKNILVIQDGLELAIDRLQQMARNVSLPFEIISKGHGSDIFPMSDCVVLHAFDCAATKLDSRAAVLPIRLSKDGALLCSFPNCADKNFLLTEEVLFTVAYGNFPQPVSSIPTRQGT
jgi:signal transduction histidine kinase